jgi:hypothetical protein
VLALIKVRPVFARFLERLFEVRRAPGRPALQDWLEVALWTTIFLLGALTAPANDAGAANAPGERWLREHTGGGICIYRRITGIECPGCGLSRGFVQLEHGEVVAAVKLNPLTPVVFFLMASRLLHYVLLCTLRLDVRNRIPWPVAWKLWGILFAAFTSIGLYRIILRFI